MILSTMAGSEDAAKCLTLPLHPGREGQTSNTGLHSTRKWVKSPVSKVLPGDSAERSESTTGEGTFKLRSQGLEGPAPEGAERAGREFLSGEEQRQRA